MKIAITVESTHDLTSELLTKFDIKVIPYTVILDGEEYKDGTFTTQEMFDFVEKKGVLPKTTALNEFEYTEFFEEILKEYDAIVHVSLSSGITSSTSHAEMAAKALKNVYIVDSLALSTGIGLLAIYGRQLADEGKTAEEIKDILDERKHKLQTSFVVERLDYLHKGGRCSSLQLLGANVFKIRPKIALKDGKMVMDKKYRGAMPNVVENYGRDLINETTPNLDVAFITFTSATEEMLEKARQTCAQIGFKTVYETFAGGTIASHCGANTIGILYFNDGEKR